jgi:uncharacterized membrane protein YfcA
MLFDLLTALVGVIGGGIASVTGFGIGSTLTPLLALRVGTKTAVAAVSGPHFLGTATRLWKLRKDINYEVLWTFGLMNAVGGLAGAVVHEYVHSSVIRIVFGGLLVFAGLAGLTGFAERMRFRGWTAWVAGIVSGALGGFSGTQGGIRAAALFGFNLPKTQFVATATAIGILVDLARMPVYFWSEWDRIKTLWPMILAAAIGVLIGTLLGERVLRLIPERYFRKIVSALILALGLMMIVLIGTDRR